MILQHRNSRIKLYDFDRAESFFTKVLASDDCWLWIGARLVKKRGGYGKWTLYGREMGAHRASALFFLGGIPDRKMVLHRCGNPPCIRPSHLYLGTAKENAHDAISEGAMARGERHGHAKLTEAEVKAMRAIRAATGMSYRLIGERFGVALSQAWRVINDENWTHIAGIGVGAAFVLWGMLR